MTKPNTVTKRTKTRPYTRLEHAHSNNVSTSEKPEINLPTLTQPMMMEGFRDQASFDSSKLTELIFGGKKAVALHAAAFSRVEKALGTNDLSRLPPLYGNTDREDMLLEGLRAGRLTVNDCLDYDHGNFYQSNHEWTLANSNPFGLTGMLFTPMLKLQCSPEQLAQWLPLAEAGQIIGSYTQTELGHGTFVAGIQTTATFDQTTDEFVVNTPDVSAIKYWPGALGYASTHTIVIARMIIGGKNFGIHSFIMQIRSLADFKPLPGIELGDIGLKMAYNGTDNGYAVFKNVRIPRANLLSRYNSVSRDGTYKADPLREKLMYGGMIGGRVKIIRNSAFSLAKALTIATRYSVVRQQGEKKSNNGGYEQAIITYKMQHYRLLTLISKAYANIFASMSSSASYSVLLDAQTRGDHKFLPYNHMLMAGLKAWSTETAGDGAETARKACGGHGYLMMSGLPEIVNSTTACCTFEGENTVMWKQVANYLMKGVAATARPEDMAYLSSYSSLSVCPFKGDDFLDPDYLFLIFEHRAARLIFQAQKLLSHEKGPSIKAANTHSIALESAARAHIDLFILRSFIDKLSDVSVELHPVLTRLVLLFAITTISSELQLSSASFIEDNYLSADQIATMRSHTNMLLEQLLPDAIALTDAWNFTDASLSSALGCRDGDVHERIWNWTRQLPINVHARANGGVLKEGWEQEVKPFLREGKLRATPRVRAKL